MTNAGSLEWCALSTPSWCYRLLDAPDEVLLANVGWLGQIVAEAWWERLGVIAAYRERWHIAGPGILGDEAGASSLQQAAHKARARPAGQEAAVLTGIIPPSAAPPSAWSASAVEVELGLEL
jgi:hypothetical protein